MVAPRMAPVPLTETVRSARIGPIGLGLFIFLVALAVSLIIWLLLYLTRFTRSVKVILGFIAACFPVLVLLFFSLAPKDGDIDQVDLTNSSIVLVDDPSAQTRLVFLVLAVLLVVVGYAYLLNLWFFASAFDSPRIYSSIAVGSLRYPQVVWPFASGTILLASAPVS